MKIDKKKKMKIVKDVKLKRFNTLEAMGEYIDPTKMEIVKHKATKKTLSGAKDSGKTVVVKAYEIYVMERDPMASTLAARKYSTAAANRLAAAFSKVLRRLMNAGFVFPQQYKKSTNKFIRITSSKDSTANQTQEYVSFEDENGLSGIDIANGGYIASVHIEEPVLKDDPGGIPEMAE